MEFNIWYSSSFTATIRNSSNHYIHWFTVSVWSTLGLWAPPTVGKQGRLFRCFGNMSTAIITCLTALVMENSSEAKHIIFRKAFLKFEVRICRVIPWAHEMKVKVSLVRLFVTPWDSPGQNTGVGSLSLLQGIFPTQGSNPGLAHRRWILYQLSHKGSPRMLEWVAYPFSIGSSRPRNPTEVSCIACGFFTNWTIRKANCQ